MTSEHSSCHRPTTDPHWARNLKHRAETVVEYRGKRHDCESVLLAGDERQQEFARLCELSPVYARYQEACKQYRELPVFRVLPKDGSVLQ